MKRVSEEVEAKRGPGAKMTKKTPLSTGAPRRPISDESKAPSISRAAAILQLLGDAGSPMGVNAIARELGFVPSSCLHILRAMTAEELVSFDPDTKQYALDVGLLKLARKWIAKNSFISVAQPELEWLASNLRVTATGVHVAGIDHTVVIAAARPMSNIQLTTPVGSRFPALYGATGRCIAAFGNHSDAELEARFRSLEWDKQLTFEEWKVYVEDTRKRGVAVDPGHYISGVTALAAPVFDVQGQLTHMIMAIAIGSLQRRALSRLQRAVSAAAEKVTRQLNEHAEVGT